MNKSVEKHRLKRTVTIHFTSPYPSDSPLGYKMVDNSILQTILDRKLPHLSITVHYNETPHPRDEYYREMAKTKVSPDLKFDALTHLYENIQQTEKIMLERFESLQHSKVVVMAQRDKMESEIRNQTETIDDLIQDKKSNSYWFGLSEHLQGRLNRLRDYFRSVFRWKHDHVKNCVHSTEGETLFDFLMKLKYYLKSEKVYSSEHSGSDGIIYIRDGNNKRYAITIKEEAAY